MLGCGRSQTVEPATIQHHQTDSCSLKSTTDKLKLDFSKRFQICAFHQRVGDMSSFNMSVAALGRPFTLGMLYDDRRDQLIPGFTVWDPKTIQDNTVQKFQPSSSFEISTSDSTESKSSLLDVEKSLKTSILSGLVDVGGSAKFLNDQKKFVNQSRVTLQYKATSYFEQFVANLRRLDKNQIDDIKKVSATHVVVGILYGANAFFVFDSEKLDSSSVQDQQHKMHAVINKIPSSDVGGNFKMQLTAEEKALTQTFSCKFHGDFILESNPSTFEDAVKTYEELPKLLGERGENSVPVKVSLLPLKNLYDGAPGFRDLSVRLVRRVHDVLEKLRQIETRCNDLLVDEVAEKFPQTKEALKSFQKSCILHRSNIQKILKEKLPSIRGGEEDESSLIKLFEDEDKSLFSHDELSKWLDGKEREFNVIRSCVGIMEGIKIVSDQSELDREVLAPGINQVLVFVFTSLESPDPYLDALSKNETTPEQQRTNEEPWYYSNEVGANMRKKARTLSNLSKYNREDFCFLVAAVGNKKHTGATIYQYNNGVLVHEDHPDLCVEDIRDRGVLLQYSCDLTIDMDTINQRLSVSEGNKKVTVGDKQRYPGNPKRFSKPQFLCKQKLAGPSYWEVECSDGIFGIGVAYDGVEKDSSIYSSEKSWCLCHSSVPVRRFLSASHEDRIFWSSSLQHQLNRVGVFLDWFEGTLSFYSVSSEDLTHLYTFHTQFTEPLYPAFLLEMSGSVFLGPFGQ